MNRAARLEQGRLPIAVSSGARIIGDMFNEESPLSMDSGLRSLLVFRDNSTEMGNYGISASRWFCFPASIGKIMIVIGALELALKTLSRSQCLQNSEGR